MSEDGTLTFIAPANVVRLPSGLLIGFHRFQSARFQRFTKVLLFVVKLTQ